MPIIDKPATAKPRGKASVGGLYAKPALRQAQDKLKPQAPRPQSVRRFPRGR